MTTKDIVETYLAAFFGPIIDLEAIRTMITADFQFQGPLMTADGAEDYIQKLKSFGENAAMSANIHTILADGETAVARYDFLVAAGPVPASEWYTVRDGKIASMQLICDPRSFFGEVS